MRGRKKERKKERKKVIKKERKKERNGISPLLDDCHHDHMLTVNTVADRPVKKENGNF